MSEAKHTPGPWVSRETPDDADFTHEINSKATPYFGVAAVYAIAQNAPANARLIAAAPDLLEALKMALVWLDYEGKYDVLAIRAAIAKATGDT